MTFILRWLASSTMVQTLVNKNLRNLAIAAGAIVAAFAARHGADHGTAIDLQNEVAGVLIALGGWGWSLVDAWLVKDKIAKARATPPPANPIAAADAAAPKDKDSLIADLQAGGPQ